MRTTFLLLIFFFLSLITSAQYTLDATVLGTDQMPLPGTTVVLLDSQDSSMIAFSIANTKGIFELEAIEKGDYILQFSFVSYKTLEESITVGGAEKKIELGKFTLKESEELLQEVEVKAERIPMGILGDTINYNAAAFKTRPGATVEDLLKKLPGIEVQRDGSIKAMGEEVENVLVDGKEFFGADPKIATRNLEAEAVDNVQVFDKKSEISEFTGIEDGSDEKTINLKLKEEYKNGGFGKVKLAGGTDSRYQGKLNYNRFSPNLQAAAIVNANNINQQAFSFNEYIGFMGGIGNAVSNNNGLFNFGEFGGNLTPQGITNAFSSGLNFNYDFSKKLILSNHYFYLRDDLKLNKNSLSNQFTENKNFVTEDLSQVNRLHHNHRINFKLNFKPNPFLQIIWKNSGSGIINKAVTFASTNFQTDGISTGLTQSMLDYNNEQFGIEGNLQLRKKFEKKGRNWINKINYQFGRFDEERNIFNLFDLQSTYNLVNQLQQYNFNTTGWKLESVFTEPIGKGLYLSPSYKFERLRESPIKDFFDLKNNNAILNPDLSRKYSMYSHTQKTGLSLKRNNKRSKINAGLHAQHSTIQGKLQTDQEKLGTSKLYLLPSADWQYELDSKSTFNAGYSTAINLPNLGQLAPIPDNSNPNILILGNPELAPEYAHNFRLSYSIFDQFNFINFYTSFNVKLTNQWINNSLTINDQFLKVYEPENVDQHMNYFGHMMFSAPIKPLKLKIRTQGTYSWSNYEGVINQSLSQIKEGNFNFSISIENRKKKHFDIATGIKVNLSTTQYAVNESFNQQFSNTKLFVEGDWFISDHWTLSSSFDYVSYSSEFFSESSQYVLWNASLDKTLLKDKLSIGIEVYDLLNQNIGLTRSGNINGLIENRFNTLSQYIMLRISYKLGKSKGKEGIQFE